jgi:WD40 repeat protein
VGPIGGVAFLADGKHVLSRGGVDQASDLTVRLWNLETGAMRTLVTAKQMLYAHATSPDGKWIAVSGLGRQLYLVEVGTGAVKELPGLGPLVITTVLAFSPDSALLASGSTDGTVRLWTVATGASQIAHRHGARVGAIRISRDGTSLASASHDLTGWVGEIVPARSLPVHATTLARTLTDSTTVVIDAENRALTPH